MIKLYPGNTSYSIIHFVCRSVRSIYVSPLVFVADRISIGLFVRQAVRLSVSISP